MLNSILTVFRENAGTSLDIQVVDVLSEVILPEYSNVLFPESTALYSELIIEDRDAPFDVTNYLPMWLVDEHESGNTLFVKFIQHYFDWLYNTDRSTLHMDNLISLGNFENLNDHTEKSIVNSYIPGLYDIVEKYEGVAFKVFGADINQEKYPGTGYFYPVYMRPPSGSYHEHNIQTTHVNDEYVKFYMPNGTMNHADPNDPIDEDLEEWHPNKVPFLYNPEKFVELIKNIQLDLYQRKTTVSCITSFFRTMLGEGLSVSTSSSNPGTIDISLTGSPTPFANRDYYLELYQELLEPVGVHSTLMINSASQRSASQEFELESARKYSKGDKAKGFTQEAYEFPLLGNYYVYHSNDTETLAPVTGCEDSTPPARGITENTSNMPTYTHPNWTVGDSGGTSFGSINIFDFIILPFEDNPNIGITSCANL